MATKFNIGDRVRIKTGLEGDTYYTTEDMKMLYCAQEMTEYGGYMAEIVECETQRNMTTYKLDIDEMYHWSDTMLEYVGKNKYKIGGLS